MTKVIHLSGHSAGTRVHTHTPSPSLAADPAGHALACGIGTIERQQAIENALSMALYFMRQPGDTAANLWAATARANRALTLLKRASEGASTIVGRI